MKVSHIDYSCGLYTLPVYSERINYRSPADVCALLRNLPSFVQTEARLSISQRWSKFIFVLSLSSSKYRIHGELCLKRKSWLAIQTGDSFQHVRFQFHWKIRSCNCESNFRPIKMFIRLLFIDAIYSSINNQSAIILEKVALQSTLYQRSTI